jgi:hypothetical protein
VNIQFPLRIPPISSAPIFVRLSVEIFDGLRPIGPLFVQPVDFVIAKHSDVNSTKGGKDSRGQGSDKIMKLLSEFHPNNNADSTLDICFFTMVSAKMKKTST